MPTNPLDPTLTEADAQMLSCRACEFLKSFVIIGVDLSNRNVSISSVAGDSTDPRLVEALTWFFNKSTKQ